MINTPDLCDNIHLQTHTTFVSQADSQRELNTLLKPNLNPKLYAGSLITGDQVHIQAIFSRIMEYTVFQK